MLNIKEKVYIGCKVYIRCNACMHNLITYSIDLFVEEKLKAIPQIIEDL
jgi:hypothetical protein